MGPLEPLLAVEFWLCRLSSRDSRLERGEDGVDFFGLEERRDVLSLRSSGGGVFLVFLENLGRKFIELRRVDRMAEYRVGMR